MGCCGSKREQWSREQLRAQVARSTERDVSKAPERPNVTFEYVGSGMLTVKGISTGQVYAFQRAGDRQVVSYEDSFALRAEPHLVVRQ